MKRYLLIILLAGIFFAGSCCQRAPVNRISEMRDSLVVEYMSYAGLFYDSSFLDWDAFVEMESQEYYLRVFQDVFDEIFAPRIDRLSENLKISKK